MLNSPFALTTQELEQLGDKGADHFTARITNLAQAGLRPLLGAYRQQQWRLRRWLHLPSDRGGRYGDGVVLVTSGDIACAINDRFSVGSDPSGENSGRLRRPAEDWDENAQNRLESNMKFAFNVLNWTAGRSNYRKGPHRAAYTRDEVSPGLDTVWKVPFGRACACWHLGCVARLRLLQHQRTRERPGSRVFAVDMPLRGSRWPR